MGCDGRTSPSATIARTNGVCADGEVVWSWRSDAGAKVVKTLSRLTGDGGNQAMVTEESTKETVKTIAQGMPVVAVYPWLLTRVLLLHTRPRVQRASGIPCALFQFEGGSFQKLGQIMSRECAFASLSTVMPRAYGASSTPRPVGLITAPLEYLDRPVIPDRVGTGAGRRR